MAQQRTKEEQELFRLEADMPHDYEAYPEDTACVMPCMNCARPVGAPVHAAEDEDEEGEQ